MRWSGPALNKLPVVLLRTPLNPYARQSDDPALASALASTGFHGKHSLLLHPRLSVNLNKIALLRNSRRTGVPEVTHFAALAYKAGADGVTVHPRPDERWGVPTSRYRLR
jgi:hypothetical protein